MLIISAPTAAASLAIDGLTLQGAKTVGQGGGLYANVKGSISVTNCVLTNNVAGKEGGGICAIAGAAVLLDNCTMSNNQAVNNGGGAYVTGTEITFSNSLLNNNTTKNTNSSYYGRGGGAYLSSSYGDVLFTKNILTGNATSSGYYNEGGGACIYSAANLQFSENKLTGNKSGSHGGGANVSSSKTSSITNNTFSSNSASSYGGGIMAGGSDMDFSNNVVADNTASGSQGAGVFFDFTGNVTIAANEISGNKLISTGYASGVYVRSKSQKITMTDNQVLNNSSGSSGGWGIAGIQAYADSDTVILTRNTVQGNTSTSGSVGGVYAYAKNEVRLTENDIMDNTAGTTVGGVYVQSALVNIENNKITGNRAGGDYGGIHAVKSTQVNLTGNDISRNTATGAYGGVWISATQVSLTGNTLTANSAMGGAGGGVYATATTQMDLSGNRINRNKATKMGGGAWLESKIINLVNNDISANEASEDMGGAYVCGSALTLTNNTISDNTAKMNGGGLYVLLKTNTDEAGLYNNIIWGNSAELLGSDLYLDNDYDQDRQTSPVKLFNNDFDRSTMYVRRLFSIDASNLNNADPLFTAAAAGDYRLGLGSPCTDAGKNDAPQVPATDRLGNPRVGGAAVDMGAYEGEFAPSYSMLTVTKTGAGKGTVTSDPAGISCGADCAEEYQTGMPVILTAVPDANSTFTGWTGADCSSAEACEVSVDRNMTVGAAFAVKTYFISGTVKAADGTVLPEVNIALSGAASNSMKTDAGGAYRFDGMLSGVYTITPSKEMYSFDPARRSANVSGADLTGQDFVGAPLGIAVKTPNGGESWQAGTSQLVEWTYTGNPDSTVKIELLKAGAVHAVLAANAPIGTEGAGSHTWAIPVAMAPGLDFQVQITSLANTSVTDVSNSHFAITEAAPVAGFTATPLNGKAPLNVVFKDTSTGKLTGWEWDFGDGTTGTDRNPTHTYTLAGSYTVSLKVTGPGGENTKTQTDYIKVEEAPPVADFTAVPTTGPAPLTVTFTDASKNKVTAWAWTFGDGGTSADQSPVHTFSQVGVYNVSLKVSGPGGEHTKTRNAFIKVTVTPMPDLAVTGASAPGRVIAGVPFRMADTVKNMGNLPAGPFTIGLYLSSDQVIDPASDILLAQRERTDLGVKKVTRGNTLITIPESTKPGSYYLGVVADNKDTVKESNESNNMKATPKPVKVEVKQADIVILEVKGPASAKIGGTIEATLALKNQGLASAGEFSVDLYLSSDSTYQAADTFLGSFKIAGLGKGQTARKPVQVSVPSTAKEGAFFLVAVADSQDILDESNELNNTKASAQTMQVTK